MNDTRKLWVRVAVSIAAFIITLAYNTAKKDESFSALASAMMSL